MAPEPHRSVTVRFMVWVTAVVTGAVAVAALAVKPPSQATIGVGPVGGSFYQTALRYQTILAERGIALTLRPRANSLEILPELANSQSGLDIGFEAQDVSEFHSSNVVNLGRIELQPLFIFASGSLGRRSVLTDLRGRRIVMPPENSATSDAAIRMFKLYDISPANSFFTFMPLADAVQRLRAGAFDAGAFMLSPNNQMIRDMALDSGLRLIPVPEAKAVSDHLPFLRPVAIPRGIYDIADGIPPVDTSLLAGRVNVAVRKDLHPYVVYSLLEAMSEVHKGATYINEAGEYPTIAGSDLSSHPLAAKFYRFGIPWTYQILPAWPASFVEAYFIIGAVLVVLVATFAAVRYMLVITSALLTVFALAYLVRADRALVRSGVLTRFQRLVVRFSERFLARSQDEQRIEDILTRIRSRQV